MVRRSRLAAIGSLLSFAVFGCDQPVGPRPALIQAEAAASALDLTYSASRADFDAQFPNLPVEGFEAGNVADGDVVGCPGPLDATSDNTCFSPGGILPGIRFNSDHTSGQDETGQDVALLGNGFGGVAHSKQLVATVDVDGFLIDFTENVTAAGMDLVSYANDICQLEVFGLNDVLLGSTRAPCTKAGTFWGVSSATPIARIRIYSPTHQFEGVDNVAFGAGVQQVPPVAQAGGPYTGVEGEPVHFDGSGSSDPGGATLTYQWDFGDGTTVADGATPDHTYAQHGTYTVTLTVSNGTMTSTATTTATIAQAPAPIARAGGPYSGSEGSPVQFDGTASSDPRGASLTYEWDFGDGSPTAGGATPSHTYADNGSYTVTLTVSNGSLTGTATATATIANVVPAGVYSVTLTVTDKDGGSDQSVFQWVVVFDAEAGFVTGGGWITSPAGAYTPNPSLTGKATFGFVSRYQKGASTPSGNTEFQFRVASLAFHSTSYDWLVIAGSKVQFKGSGTINGAGDFGFMLTAVDGDLKGGDDTFRMRIWDNATGVVIYDNQMGSGNGTPASTALGGGSIVIHQ